MSTGLITPQLPSLRRYARFLCGSQAEADQLIGGTLERLAEHGWTGKTRDRARRDLFAAFHELWIPVDSAFATDVTGQLDEIVSKLEPYDRAVYLLVCFEDFTPREAADFLTTSEQDVHARLSRMKSAYMPTAARRVLIVEDEALTAMQLEQIVAALGHEVVGPTVTRAEAVRVALARAPDLILSDIELEDRSSGIDTVQEIRRSIDVPVVFITAHSRRLMDRMLTDDTWLVKKPLNQVLLRGCIDEAFRLGST